MRINRIEIDDRRFKYQGQSERVANWWIEEYKRAGKSKISITWVKKLITLNRYRNDNRTIENKGTRSRKIIQNKGRMLYVEIVFFRSKFWRDRDSEKILGKRKYFHFWIREVTKNFKVQFRLISKKNFIFSFSEIPIQS